MKQTKKMKRALLWKTQEFLKPPCEKCSDDYYNREWKRNSREIEENQELVFKGLGG